jgi:anaerobic selenocysteine-containing dehydrogenase
VNETTRHANVILPPAWTLAEEHFDLLFPLFSVRNVARRSPPVVEPRPGELQDWQILLDLARRLGGGPTGVKPVDRVLNLAERLGLPWSPRPTLAFLLRTGAWGRRFPAVAQGGNPLRDLDAAPRHRPPVRSGPGSRIASTTAAGGSSSRRNAIC